MFLKTINGSYINLSFVNEIYISPIGVCYQFTYVVMADKHVLGEFGTAKEAQRFIDSLFDQKLVSYQLKQQAE